MDGRSMDGWTDAVDEVGRTWVSLDHVQSGADGTVW